MKNIFHKCAVGVGVAAIMTASALNATSFQSEKVDIPFAFQVAKTAMPAGEYKVQQGFGSDIAFLVNLKTGQQVQVLRGVGNQKQDRAKLVFEKTGSSHKLKAISY